MQRALQAPRFRSSTVNSGDGENVAPDFGPAHRMSTGYALNAPPPSSPERKLAQERERHPLVPSAVDIAAVRKTIPGIACRAIFAAWCDIAFDGRGWLRTRDLARIDHEGYIYIVDRMKEMLVSGGFNIYSTEVESVLAQHPAIYEVCVVGVPDEHWGEPVKSVVVLREGAQATGGELPPIAGPHAWRGCAGAAGYQSESATARNAFLQGAAELHKSLPRVPRGVRLSPDLVRALPLDLRRRSWDAAVEMGAVQVQGDLGKVRALFGLNETPEAVFAVELR